MRRSSVSEYAEAMRERYRAGGRAEKGHLLDEFTAVTGYHRKSAVRLLSGRSRGRRAKKMGRPRRYDDEVVVALKQVWETADRICGKRLKPFMGEAGGQDAGVGGAAGNTRCGRSAMPVECIDHRPAAEASQGQGTQAAVEHDEAWEPAEGVDTDQDLRGVTRTVRVHRGGPGGPLWGHDRGVLPEHPDGGGHSHGLGGVSGSLG